MNNTRFEVFNTDCFVKLASLPAASVDMALLDPPYGTTNLEFDKHPIDLTALWEQLHRVCRETAIIGVFAAQPFTTDVINSNRKAFRYDLCWQKTNPVGFLSANVRPLRSHESVLIFCRKFGRVQGQMQSVYNPQFTAGKPYVHRSRARPAAHYSAVRDVGTYKNEGRRYPTSVVTYGRDVPSLHPTAKPVPLLQYLIRTYSNPGDMVLDCFMGAGSTGEAALREERCFTGMELDPAYFAIAERRLREVAQ